MKKSTDNKEINQETVDDHSDKRKPIYQVTLENTMILDNDVESKFMQKIEDIIDVLDSTKCYSLTVYFPNDFVMDFLKEQRLSSTEREFSKLVDDVSKLISEVLEKLVNVLEDKEIQISSSAINGVSSNGDNSIKVEIFEDVSNLNNKSKGKNKKPLKYHLININSAYSYEMIGKLYAEKFSEVYFNLMSAVRDNRYMAEILEIKSTKDKDLYAAFVTQYYDLINCTKERRDELVNQLLKRLLLF